MSPIVEIQRNNAFEFLIPLSAVWRTSYKANRLTPRRQLYSFKLTIKNMNAAQITLNGSGSIISDQNCLKVSSAKAPVFAGTGTFFSLFFIKLYFNKY